MAMDSISERRVAIGEMVVAQQTGCLSMLVGSCIGLFLHVPAARVAVACHILLADSGGCTEMPGRYADTAVAEALRRILTNRVQVQDIVASVIGGANMFGGGSTGRIGLQNETIVKQHLAALCLPIAIDDCGDNVARRIHMDVQTGQIKIVKLLSFGSHRVPDQIPHSYNLSQRHRR